MSDAEIQAISKALENFSGLDIFACAHENCASSTVETWPSSTLSKSAGHFRPPKNCLASAANYTENSEFGQHVFIEQHTVFQERRTWQAIQQSSTFSVIGPLLHNQALSLIDTYKQIFFVSRGECWPLCTGHTTIPFLCYASVHL
jgi:hypothetical protein